MIAIFPDHTHFADNYKMSHYLKSHPVHYAASFSIALGIISLNVNMSDSINTCMCQGWIQAFWNGGGSSV